MFSMKRQVFAAVGMDDIVKLYILSRS